MSGVRGDFKKLAETIVALEGMKAVAQQSMNAAAAVLETKARSCFRQRRAPDGTPWAPTVKPDPAPVHETGKLEDSIHGHAYPSTATLEATDPKARYHQEGTDDMEARPFFPPPGELPERWAKDLRAIPKRMMRLAARGRG